MHFYAPTERERKRQEADFARLNPPPPAKRLGLSPERYSELEAEERARAEIRQRVAPQRTWNPGTAAVLSFFIPGLGQLYKGQILDGFLYFVCTAIGTLAFIVPGALIWLWGIHNAYSFDPNKPSISGGGLAWAACVVLGLIAVGALIIGLAKPQ